MPLQTETRPARSRRAAKKSPLEILQQAIEAANSRPSLSERAEAYRTLALTFYRDFPELATLAAKAASQIETAAETESSLAEILTSYLS